MKTRIKLGDLLQYSTVLPVGFIESVRSASEIDGEELVIEQADLDAINAASRQQILTPYIEAHFTARTAGHRIELQKWIAAGRPLRSEAAEQELKAICRNCVDVVCRSSLCADYGRRMATWNCPLGLWPKESAKLPQ